MANIKLCPFAAAIPNQKNAVCLYEECACYVEIEKPITMQIDDNPKVKIVDGEFYYSYKGCGLVQQVPWQIKERPGKAKTPYEKAAQEAYRKLEVPA